MKNVFTIFLGMIPLLAFAQLSERAKDSMELFAPRPVGTLEGNVTSKEIGTAGGELATPDNKVRLVFPEGALSKNTVISIQAASNTALDGVGKSFQLEPSGIHFNKPVQLTIHYDTRELMGSSPELLAMVFQDEKGYWFSIGKFKIDTASKTVTGSISHFSYWALGWSIHLKPEKSKVKVSKKVFIKFYPQPCWPESDYEDRHYMILDIFGENLENPRIWSVNGVVNGDANNGMIDGEYYTWENGVHYTAPAMLPDNNPVEIKIDIVGATLGELDREKRTMTKTCKIKVYDNYYEVKMVTTMKGGGKEVWGGMMTYRDEGSFLISVDQDPTLLEIDNRLEQLKYSNCEMIILNPATRTGMINVTGIKSWKITPANPPTIPYPLLEISFIPKPAEFTMFYFNCPPPPGAVAFSRGSTGPFLMRMQAMPIFIKFKLNDEEQVIQKIGNPGDEMYVRFTVKKKQD